MKQIRISICALYVLFAFAHTNAAGVHLDDVTIDILLRIDALEKQEQHQKMVNQRQQEQLERQNEYIGKLESKLIDYEAIPTQLKRQEELLTSELEIVNKAYIQQAYKIDVLEDEVKIQQQTIATLTMAMKTKGLTTVDNEEKQTIITEEKSSVMEDVKVRNERLVLGDVEGPIAFQARIDGAEVAHIGINQKIVFDKVISNIGGGYRNQHGIFTAPQSGIYIFSVSILSYINTHSEVQASLMKNGQTIAKVFAHGDSGREDQGSVTIVTQLAAGDEVWVQNVYIANTSIYGGGFTAFMGCLITPV